MISTGNCLVEKAGGLTGADRHSKARAVAVSAGDHTITQGLKGGAFDSMFACRRVVIG
ncbi:MAG: hypothetical protein LBG61_04055 [Burkholderiales bacterium]|nr:hypothetical protein [Burkholderiales bacterium]